MDGFNTLLDVLAIIIGFSAVMLLLSLIVTAMVQATQHLFRMRSANLRDGLEMVIGQAAGNVSAAETARVLIETASLPPSKSPLGRLLDALAPRARTWIEPEEIGEYLKEAATKLTDRQIEDAARRFQRAERLMTMRFVGRIRVVTLLWALLVPMWFQVDSLALLRNLSLQPELRAAAVGLGPQVAGEAEETLQALGSDEDVSDFALAGLAAVRESAARANSAAGYLGAFNLHPFQAGWAFYWSLSNLIGVLVTTLALMLGAPFWFKVLKSAVGLRDTLKPARRDKEESGS